MQRRLATYLRLHELVSVPDSALCCTKMLFGKAAALLSTVSAVSAKLTWGSTKFLFAFGDSYTTDGFNISAGVDSLVPDFVGASRVERRPHSHESFIPPVLDFFQRPELGTVPRLVFTAPTAHRELSTSQAERITSPTRRYGSFPRAEIAILREPSRYSIWPRAAQLSTPLW